MLVIHTSNYEIWNCKWKFFRQEKCLLLANSGISLLIHIQIMTLQDIIYVSYFSSINPKHIQRASKSNIISLQKHPKYHIKAN